MKLTYRGNERNLTLLDLKTASTGKILEDTLENGDKLLYIKVSTQAGSFRWCCLVSGALYPPETIASNLPAPNLRFVDIEEIIYS